MRILRILSWIIILIQIIALMWVMLTFHGFAWFFWTIILFGSIMYEGALMNQHKEKEEGE